MTEEQFLNELDRYLEKLNENERKDIRRDFIEYFEHGRSEDKTTAEMIDGLGDIPELATEILAAYTEEEFTDKISYHSSSENIPFNNIHVQAQNVALTIKAADIEEPYVDIKDKDQLTQVDLSIQDNTLHVQINRKEKQFRILFFTFISKTSSVDATLYLPVKQYNEIIAENDNGVLKAKKLQFMSCQLHSDNGRVVVKKCTGSILNASSHNGRVIIEKSQIETIDAVSHNGRVVTASCQAKTVFLKSDNGRIHCQYTTGNVEAHTSNGQVKIEMEQAAGNMNVHTDNGSISVITKEQLENCQIKLKSSVGSTSVYGTKTKSYSHGNETYLLKLHSDIGSIKVKQFETELVS